MENTSYDFLQKERQKLAQRVRYDELTGVLSHTAIRKAVNQEKANGGTLFLANIDRIEWINQKYGHLEGDRSLYTAAKLLSYMVGTSGQIGRIGSTEFLIYVPTELSMEQIEAFEQRVAARFLSEERKNNKSIGLHVLLTGCLVYPKASYEALVSQLREQLHEKIQQKPEQLEIAEHAMTGWNKDISQIRSDMEEEIRKSGAFCPDYDTFKGIYRFLERCMLRNNQHVCVILFSLENDERYEHDPEEKERKMQQLGELLQQDLRLGDVFTRYSSCQYLALVVDVDEELAERVAHRVRDHFVKKTGDTDSVIIHCCYELHSAKLLIK